MSDPSNNHTSLTPYVPEVLANWLASSPYNSYHAVTSHTGTVMFIDLSGFTAMTQRFARTGAEGTEQLTDLINRYFALTAGLIRSHGGDILKFAGDAVWTLLPKGTDLHPLFNSISTKLKNVDPSLSIHGAAVEGSFYLVSVGTPGSRREVEPVGSLIAEVARQADLAESGRLHTSVADNCENSVQRDRTITTPHYAGFEEKIGDYLVPEVRSRLESGMTQRRLDYEHRDVVVLFAEFMATTELDGAVTIDHLRDHLELAFQILNRHEGTIARLDPCGPGHKLLVLFGAPVQHIDDPLHAVQAARELLALSSPTISTRIGLASGPLFCGEVGADWRREYTVMGDPVNLAARLMTSAASGSILFDSRMRERLNPTIGSVPHTMHLKGIDHPTVAHEFDGVRSESDTLSDDSPLIGYDSEMVHLRDFCRSDYAQRGRVLVLTGSAGTGKTSLLALLCRSSALEMTRVDGNGSALHQSGWTAREFLGKLITNSPHCSGKSLDSIIEEHIDTNWLPLAAPLLNREFPETEWTAGLKHELRKQKSVELFLSLVSHLCLSPRVCIIDHLERTDEYSRELFYGLAAGVDILPVGLILSVRTLDESQSLTANSEIQRIDLQGPSHDEWWNYFASRFHDGKLEREYFSSLLSSSERNPLFITQMIEQAVASGELVQSQFTGKLERSGDAQVLQMPTSIREALLYRFDRLPEAQRSLLKAACVLPATFTESELESICTASHTLYDPQSLGRLTEIGILVRGEDAGTCDFAHSTMREVIYSCLPVSQRVAYHQALFSLIRSSQDLRVSVKAYHAFRAQLWSEAFSLSLTAAVASLGTYSLSEAGSNFRQCEESLGHLPIEAAAPKDLFEFRHQNMRCAELTGSLHTAYISNRRWRHTARKLANVRQWCQAIAETSHLLWTQSKYRQCERFIMTGLSQPSIEEHPAIKARLLSIQAEIHRRRGEFSEAIRLTTEAVALAGRHHDRTISASVFNKLGLALWGAGKLVEAAEAYEQSLAVGQHSRFARAQATNNLAIIYWEQGDLQKAARLMEEAAETFRQIGDRRNESYVAGNLASLQQVFGNYGGAKDNLQRADEVFMRAGDDHAHHYALGNIGDIELITGDLVSAKSKYEAVAAFAAAIDDKELAAECEVRLGEHAFYSGRSDEAEQQYRRAIASAEAIGSREFQIRGSIGLARLLVGQRKAPELMRLIERIRTFAEETRAVLPLHEVSFLEGEWYRINEETDEAIKRYQTVLEYASAQSMFELTLKCAVRLFELSRDWEFRAMRLLARLAFDHEAVNGEGSWQRLTDSPYFTFFAHTLLKTTSRDALIQSHHQWD